MSRIDAAVDRASRRYDWVDSRLDLDDANDFLGKAFPAEDSVPPSARSRCSVSVSSSRPERSSRSSTSRARPPSSTAAASRSTRSGDAGRVQKRPQHHLRRAVRDVPAAHAPLGGAPVRRVDSVAHAPRVLHRGVPATRASRTGSSGTGLAGLAMFAAYTGYSLPYDESSRARRSVSATTSPPRSRSSATRSRASSSAGSSRRARRSCGCSSLHVFLIPAAIAGLIAVHMAILVRQKHTEAQRDEDVAAAGGAVVPRRRAGAPRRPTAAPA